jgi:hypothetical protein
MVPIIFELARRAPEGKYAKEVKNLFAILSAFFGCPAPEQVVPKKPRQGSTKRTLQLKSDSYQQGKRLPPEFGCRGTSNAVV